ncbi:uncharacterized protein Z519_10737 [Cladophialophora bantiana CBS 173.52]|uniref:Uncharacterized protein n=1 Tax=Cladophialophora bantiana (strain ATCC 10958 / CBS 173.52 / CDC B-1940 / NIH 8579) TaxID=1442370 RepID=A0A0D2EF26_CLAB1|nr:uncharacterized protein Z519_10737 [Cladophialophora bantiana CBS 173.52]KIW88691.1 hypothetical protein Z519_10737 [Cladophialophora bantiana CBS 173.52]
MPIGRPRIPGTDAERAEVRRAKVRANVQAFRKRQKEKKLAEQAVQRQINEEGLVQPHEALLQKQPTVPLLPHGCSQTCEASVFPPEDPEFWLQAMPSEMVARLARTTYHDAFVDVLRHRFVAPQRVRERTMDGPEQGLSMCYLTWVTAATLEIGRSETEVLMEALLAASLAKVGRDQNEPGMTIHGAYMQTQLITNKSWDNFNSHLCGVGALISHGGVEGLNHQLSQEHFYRYRAIQTPFLFMNRQKAFLCDPEWTNFPWKKDLELARHPLHSMLDIALKALPEIAKQEMPKSWTVSCLRERLEKACTIVAELNEWERQLRFQHRGVLYTEVPATWEGVYKRRLDFPNISIAITFAMYAAARIHVATLVADVSDEIIWRVPTADIHSTSAVWEALRWARLACQSLEYFRTDQPKAAGRIVTLWPLETAWELFARVAAGGSVDVSQEIAWCRSAAEQHANLGIPPFKWR